MELREQVRAMHEAKAEELSRENRGFVQVYPQGWQRIRSLMSENPTAAKVYAVLAEHIDPSCGAVVVSQTFWRKWSACPRGPSEGDSIPRGGAGVGPHTGERIRLCLRTGPERGLARVDCQKEQAAFLTRTLVKKNGQNALVKRRLQMMLREQTGEPELQLEQDFDPETGRFGHRKMLEFSK